MEVHSCSKRGAPTAISQTLEKLIVKLILFLAEIGFGLNKQDIMTIVTNYLQESEDWMLS
jgi:hypothetical protein